MVCRLQRLRSSDAYPYIRPLRHWSHSGHSSTRRCFGRPRWDTPVECAVLCPNKAVRP